MRKDKKVTVKGAAKRVLARDSKMRSEILKDIAKGATLDSFQNFAAKLGIGTDNLTSASTYGFNPITRLRVLLEWIHRGSWLGGVAVDLVADDMTRAGVDLKGTLEPDVIEELHELSLVLGIWKSLNSAIKWGRLYGGALAVYMIDGQDPSTPLRVERVGKNQFRGLLVLDRWMVEPSLENLVTTFGPNLGQPKFYRVVADAPALPRMTIHHSRVIRFEGNDLPYYQKLAENLWGESVLERLYDRMVAFDSATTGASQLVYKSYLRHLKIENLREIASSGGIMEENLVKYVNFMRRYQGIEGVTMIDSKDEFGEGGAKTAMTGVGDIIDKLGEQLSGALQIPLVRLFGQSPGGLNASGESDLRTYYDGIHQKQSRDLKSPVTDIYRMIAQSASIALPDGFSVQFRSLWQLKDEEKADIAGKVETAVGDALDRGIISQAVAMKELRQSSEVTSVFSNISDEDIAAAEQEPTMPSELQQQELEQSALGAGGPAAEGDAPTGDSAGGERVTATVADSVANLAALKSTHGLDVVIENEKGSERSGMTPTGEPWSARLAADYGYIRMPSTRSISGRTGADGDQLDCFVGPDVKGSETTFIIDQRNLVTGGFDEHKVMVGFPTREEALHAYKSSYSDGRGGERIGAVTEMNPQQFGAWMVAADLTKPASGWFGKINYARAAP